jgi:hypothetical protein
MIVALFFYQPFGRTEYTWVHGMYGKYNIAGFVFVQDTFIEAFYTSLGGAYRRAVWTRRGESMLPNGESDFVILSLDDSEKKLIRDTCLACARVSKPFNLLDLLLIHLPYNPPDNFTIFTTPTLNNAQAIILILRQCLTTDNVLSKEMDALHSRKTFLEDLFVRIGVYTLPVTWSNLIDFVAWI